MNADNFINYSAVSKLLTGTKRAINSNRVPDKHSIAINELRNFVKKWIEKNSKKFAVMPEMQKITFVCLDEKET